MTWSDLPRNPAPRALRQFAGAWIVCFLALAFRFGLLRHAGAGLVLGAVALAGVSGLIAPRTLRLLFVAASVLAFPIGWVVTNVALAVMFYAVITPVALVFRMRGRDALQLHQRDKPGCWTTRGGPPAPEKYLKQY